MVEEPYVLHALARRLVSWAVAAEAVGLAWPELVGEAHWSSHISQRLVEEAVRRILVVAARVPSEVSLPAGARFWQQISWVQVVEGELAHVVMSARVRQLVGEAEELSCYRQIHSAGQRREVVVAEGGHGRLAAAPVELAPALASRSQR